MDPHLPPNLAFFPCLMLNLISSGASKMWTMLEPWLNSPMPAPLFRQLPIFSADLYSEFTLPPDLSWMDRSQQMPIFSGNLDYGFTLPPDLSWMALSQQMPIFSGDLDSGFTLPPDLAWMSASDLMFEHLRQVYKGISSLIRFIKDIRSIIKSTTNDTTVRFEYTVTDDSDIETDESEGHGTTENEINERVEETNETPTFEEISDDYGRLIVDVANDLTLDSCVKIATLFGLLPAETDMLRRVAQTETPGITLINFLQTRNIINKYDVTNLQKALAYIKLNQTNENLLVPYQSKLLASSQSKAGADPEERSRGLDLPCSWPKNKKQKQKRKKKREKK